MTVVSQIRPVILSSSSDADLGVLQALADFWKIPSKIISPDASLPTFTTQPTDLKRPDGPGTILAPRARDAEEIAKILTLEHISRKARLTLPYAPGIECSIGVETHDFSGANLEPILKSGKVTLLSRIEETNNYLSSIDLVGEYSRRLFEGFEDRPSLRFRLVTSLPLSYRAVPRFLRDASLRTSDGLSLLNPENLGPVEFLRTLFLASLVVAFGPVPRVRFWPKGRSFGVAVTHDVETAHGLEQGAPALLSVENQIGLRSTWNVPSNRYPITSDSLHILTVSGEIGGHDTTHDGRLLLVRKAQKVRRLKNCKETLEQLSRVRVRGFRAPLLQHGLELAEAETLAGYDYDSSAPSFEMLSPTSMRPHGVGTVFPFKVNGVLEIPVTLPQDHQLIRVAGQEPDMAVDLILQISKWIKGIGGACVLLVHPDYELATEENLPKYRRLLEHFTSDPTCHVATLAEMADWWNLRATAKWDTSGGRISLVSSVDGRDLAELEGEFVTGFGSNGFSTRPLS